MGVTNKEKSKFFGWIVSFLLAIGLIFGIIVSGQNAPASVRPTTSNQPGWATPSTRGDSPTNPNAGSHRQPNQTSDQDWRGEVGDFLADLTVKSWRLPLVGAFIEDFTTPLNHNQRIYFGLLFLLVISRIATLLFSIIQFLWSLVA